MPRYADTDALLSDLPDDLPYKASVKRVLIQAPAADVVPKSEVDKIFNEVKTLIDEYFDGLYTSGEFVEIFTELQKKYVVDVKT